jgi:hypothetical protein
MNGIHVIVFPTAFILRLTVNARKRRGVTAVMAQVYLLLTLVWMPLRAMTLRTALTTAPVSDLLCVEMVTVAEISLIVLQVVIRVHVTVKPVRFAWLQVQSDSPMTAPVMMVLIIFVFPLKNVPVILVVWRMDMEVISYPDSNEYTVTRKCPSVETVYATLVMNLVSHLVSYLVSYLVRHLFAVAQSVPGVFHLFTPVKRVQRGSQ